MTETRRHIRREQAIDTAVIAGIWLWDKTLGRFADESQRRELRQGADRMRVMRRERAARTEQQP
jgi:hypothetical protein